MVTQQKSDAPTSGQNVPKPTNTGEYISVDEMAKMLSIARATAYQLAKTNGFPCFYIGKRIIIPLQSFNEWAASQANNQAVFLDNQRG